MADLGALLGAAGIGGAIGQAIVRLELDTSKYSAELKAAQLETTAGANTMGTGLTKFSGLAASAFAAAGVAAVAFGAFSVKAAVDANNAHIALQNTFANNERLSDSSVAAFERQAGALRDLTGVDDEAIIRGQALLGQFRLTGAQVQELTPLIVDLSAKMGIDLEAAAKAVGKATEGNTGALARYIGTIEAGATPTETYANILEKLGRVQGFAADRAEAEPWRVLAAQFEELAEKLGQVLLPLIQDFVNALIDALPILEKFGAIASKAFEISPGLIQALGALGRLKSDLAETFPEAAALAEKTIQWGRELSTKVSPAVERFAYGILHLGETTEDTQTAIQRARKTVETFTLSLDETAEQAKITRREFLDATRVMQREAEQLDTALRRISKEKWVNDEYIKFLSEQGPDWIIGFSKLTEEEQRKAQKAWRESTDATDAANRSLGKITEVLDNLDKGESKHKVIIEYEYVGFDPSKPGMSDRTGRGGPQ